MTRRQLTVSCVATVPGDGFAHRMSSVLVSSEFFNFPKPWFFFNLRNSENTTTVIKISED